MAKFKEYIKSGSDDLAVLLIDQHHDFDPMSVSFPKGFDCLQMACSHGMPKLVLLLLEEGHSATTVNTITRQTPLHFAARGGHIVIIGLLLQYGADHLAQCKKKEN